MSLTQEMDPVDNLSVSSYIMFVRDDVGNSRCTVTDKSGKIFKVFRYLKMRLIILDGVNRPCFWS